MAHKTNVVAMLLAGGQGSRLGVLTKNIAKPAVPYGGNYRIIDFPLSNCVNSGIYTVGVLTQYQPLELNDYLGNGQRQRHCKDLLQLRRTAQPQTHLYTGGICKAGQALDHRCHHQRQGKPYQFSSRATGQLLPRQTVWIPEPIVQRRIHPSHQRPQGYPQHGAGCCYRVHHRQSRRLALCPIAQYHAGI